MDPEVKYFMEQENIRRQILKLKSLEQTPEVKLQIQKLQQKLDE